MTSDEMIVALIARGHLRVDANAGIAYAPRSNTPLRPLGHLTRKGYLRTGINVDGRLRRFMIHRIIWVSVHGPLPPGHEVDHLDRTAKTDNRLSRLEAVPSEENVRRATLDGAFKNNGRKDKARDRNGRFGKKAAGATLDGREHREFPT